LAVEFDRKAKSFPIEIGKFADSRRRFGKGAISPSSPETAKKIAPVRRSKTVEGKLRLRLENAKLQIRPRRRLAE